MVVANAQPDNMPHGDRVVAVGIGHYHGLLEDPAHSQDGYLRLQDDRQSKLRAEDAWVRDGDGASLNVIGHQLFAAGALAQIADGALQSYKAQVLRALDHRHDQAPVQRHGNADVDVLVVLDGVSDYGGVDDRLYANSVQHGLGDERHIGQLDAVARLPGFAVRFAEPGNARHIDFENRVNMRAGVLGFHHALGNLLAHRGHGHEFA